MQAEIVKKNTMNVFEKLARLRIALLREKIEKSGNNKYAGFNYFELNDFMPIVLRKCAEIGLIGLYSYNGESGMAQLEMVNTEKPDERIVFTCPFGRAQLKGCHEIQNIGACITYTRRYLWIMAMELGEYDELDAVAGKESSLRMDDARRAELQVLVNDCKTVDELTRFWKANAANMNVDDAKWLGSICGKKKNDLLANKAS